MHVQHPSVGAAHFRAARVQTGSPMALLADMAYSKAPYVTHKSIFKHVASCMLVIQLLMLASKGQACEACLLR